MNTVIKAITLPFITLERFFKIFSLKNTNDYKKVDQAINFQEQAIQMRLINTPFL